MAVVTGNKYITSRGLIGCKCCKTYYW